MRSLRKDTLAYQLGMRPAFQPLDSSKAQLQDVVFALNGYMKLDNIYATLPDANMQEAPLGCSEVDALMFYMLNHAVSIVRTKRHPLEPLGEYLPILEMHARELAVRSSRMFFYLLLICTRESRHNQNNASLYATLATKYPKEIFSFHSDLPHGSTEAANALKKKAPAVRLGEYTNWLADVFFMGKYGSMFGGKKWGAIAQVLTDYVHGKLTAELMLDTGFTLAHNGGPIFNKGMLYEQYSQNLYHILDVQRSGQIPQLVASNTLPKTKNFHVQSTWKRCRKILGPEFDGYVDYFKVEELGAVKQYKTQQAQQVESYGYPEGYKGAKKPSMAFPGGGPAHTPFVATKAKPFQTIDSPDDSPDFEALNPNLPTVEIYPGEYVQKVKVRP